MNESLPTRTHGWQEATRDPIYILERRVWIYCGMPHGYEVDADGDVVLEGAKPDEETGETAMLTSLELSEMETPDGYPCVIESWVTDRVWFTREEGEAYGKARAYNYRDGWRVYAVCAEGDLAALLKSQTSRDEVQP